MEPVARSVAMSSIRIRPLFEETSQALECGTCYCDFGDELCIVTRIVPLGKFLCLNQYSDGLYIVLD